MEPETTDYRLERWIAIILSLLFFLPFVARGEEILYTSTYQPEELRTVTGESFLALIAGETTASLEPTTVAVASVRQPGHEGMLTRLDASDFEDVFLVRGSRLSAGPVVAADPAPPAGRTRAAFALGATLYEVRCNCSAHPDPDGFVDCTLWLEHEGRTQVLLRFPVIYEGEVETDVLERVAFAGDLDRDGRLDLIADVSGHWNEWRVALFLSSAAEEGDLVAQVAEFRSNGC
jgi:hypothetical protein